jgi:hypothetical protein
MIQEETVRALLEAKENLERAQEILHQIYFDTQGELQDQSHQAHRWVTDTLVLIESILAKGR